MESPWTARKRAATSITAAVNSQAILDIFGIINSTPWEAVKVMASAAVSKAPCSAPAASAFAFPLTTLSFNNGGGGGGAV